MQLTFKLPEINREETRNEVEKALESYKMFLLMDPEDMQPTITASFKLTPPTNTNQFSSTTEDVAIQRVDMERKRKKYIAKIQRAVNRLNYEEGSAIIKRYLTYEDGFDYEVYNELGYRERKYYRIKSR